MPNKQTVIELILEDGQIVGSTSRVNAALQSIEDKTKNLGKNTGFDQFAASIKQFIQDPLGAAGDAVEKLLKTMGPAGTSIAAGAGAFAALGAAAFSAVKDLASLGIEYQNLSIRTGISASEVGNFAFAAKMSGQDVSVFETVMRRLSQGMDDNSERGKASREELQRLGITVKDIHGAFLPTVDIFNQISEVLTKMGSAAERDAAMMAIAGRSGVEAVPTFLELNKNLKIAKDLGLAPSKDELAGWKVYHDELTVAGAKWDYITRQIKEGAAATLAFWFAYSTGGPGAAGKQHTMTFPLGGEKPPAPGMQYAGLLETRPAISVADAFRIQENDRRVTALRLGGLPDQLSAAQQDLQSLQGKLQTGVLPEVNTKTEADIAGAKTKVARLQAQVDAASEAAKAAQARAGQLAKDEATTRALIQHRSVLVGIAGGPQASSQIQGDIGDIVPYDKEGLATVQAGITENVAEYRKILEGVIQGDQQAIEELHKRITAGDEAARGEIEKQAGGIEKGAGQQASLAGARFSLQMVGRTSDGQVALAQQELDIRLKELDNELALKQARSDLFDMAKEQYDYDNRAQTAQFDFEMKILELKTQAAQKDQETAGAFGRQVVGFANAAQTGGHRGISQFFRGQGHSLEDTLIGNVSSTAYKGFISNLVPHAPQGFFGDILKGTPFAPKTSDEKILSDATLENTLATRQNTSAMMARTGYPGGGYFPGGGGGTAGLGTGFPALSSSSWFSMPGAAALSDTLAGGGGGAPSLPGSSWFDMSSAAALSRAIGGGSTAFPQLTGMLSLAAKLKGAGTAAGGFMGDIGSGAADPLGILFGKDDSQGGSYTGTASVGQDVGAALGIAGAGLGTYSGIAQIARGGAHNAAAGIGTSLMSIAPLTGPAAPFLMAAGMASQFVSMLLGDPRQQRGTQISNFLSGRAYAGPDPVSYARTMSGQDVGTDMFGNARTVGNSTTNVTIHAMDSESFGTFLNNHPTQLDAGVYNVIQNGSKTVPALRQQLLGG